MAKYVIGVDAGTTGIRAIAFDKDSNILSNAYSEFTQHFPEPGWVEHDANEIFDVTMNMIKQCVEEGGLSFDDMVAIGITNQRETTVFWDKNTGKAVCPSIVWQDMRTADRVTEVNEKYGEDVIGHELGSMVFTNSTGPKIEWILNHYPEVKKGVDEGDVLFGWIDSWLIWKLSGGKAHVTDSSNSHAAAACGDIKTLGYSEIAKKEFGFTDEMMPTIVKTGEFKIDTDPSVFFGYSIPIAASAGDQTSAAIGQACIKPGMIKNTFGTGSFIVMNVGDKIPDIPVFTGIFVEPANDIADKQRYAIEGMANVSGSAVQWLRDGAGVVEDAKQAEELANSVKDNGGVYFVPAFAGLPNGSDPYARGTIIGITRGTTKAHLCRAAIEGMAYQVAESFEEMAKHGGVEISTVRVDGGGAKNNFLCQFLADILGVPVEKPVITETTCLGAAYLAGVNVGFWKDMDEVAQKWQCEQRFEPRLSKEEREEQMAGWKKAIEHAKGWLKS